jgi:hypothetical protein
MSQFNYCITLSTPFMEVGQSLTSFLDQEQYRGLLPFPFYRCLIRSLELDAVISSTLCLHLLVE